MSSFDNMTEEDLSKMNKDLESQLQQRNTLTVVEFDEFRPLFNSDDIKAMAKDEIDDLSDKYAELVSLFHPVIVTDATIDAKEIFRLPAMFTRTPTLNTLGSGVATLMNAYNNAMNQASMDPIAINPAKMTAVMQHCVGKAVEANRNEVVKQVQTFGDTVEDLQEKNLLPSSKGETKKKVISEEVDDFEWEEE